MSRTRQKPNELPLWVWPLKVTDTDGHIENSNETIGIKIDAEDLGTKTREEREVLSGRVLQSTTVQQYVTYNQLELNIGDQVSTVPNPNEFEKSSIVRIMSKPQNKRGARHNTTRVIKTTFEVS